MNLGEWREIDSIRRVKGPCSIREAEASLGKFIKLVRWQENGTTVLCRGSNKIYEFWSGDRKRL